jgi:hypothetical protein
MDNIILLADSVSVDQEIRKKAKAKLQLKKEQGNVVRVGSLGGLVKKRDIQSAQANDTTSGSPSQTQPATKRAKNFESVEMENILKDLDAGTEKFQEELREREKREKETLEKRERREEERHEGICRKLDNLVEAIQRDNEQRREQNQMMQTLLANVIQNRYRGNPGNSSQS